MATVAFLLPSVLPDLTRGVRKLAASPRAVLRPPWGRKRPRPAPSPAVVRALVAQFVVHELDRRRSEAEIAHRPKVESRWRMLGRWIRLPWVSRILLLVALVACLAPPVALLV